MEGGESINTSCNPAGLVQCARERGTMGAAGVPGESIR